MCQLASFIGILGAFGGWIGSATVQHLTGLTLTQPIVSALGPMGLIGSFGIYQAGLKAVLSPARLRAFGWSRDQTPARGIAEALTTAATEHDRIHYGFEVDRQQAHLIPDYLPKPLESQEEKYIRRSGGQWQGNKRWMSTGKEQATARANTCERTFKIRATGANANVTKIRIANNDEVGPGVYHANVTWLGRRRGVFVTCADKNTFNERLCLSFLITIYLSFILMTGMIIGEINLLGGGFGEARVPQVAIYCGAKALTVLVIHLRFLLTAKAFMPGKSCEAAADEGDGRERQLHRRGDGFHTERSCHPARLRIYKQKYAGVGTGFCATAYVYCERSYRVIQGYPHPALDGQVTKTTDKDQYVHSRFYTYGGRERERPPPPPPLPIQRAFLRRLTQSFTLRDFDFKPVGKKIAKVLDFSLPVLSLVFLFSYAYYLSWLTMHACDGVNKNAKVLGWSALELFVLLIKMFLLAGPPILGDNTFPMTHGSPVCLVFQLGRDEEKQCTQDGCINVLRQAQQNLKVTDELLRAGALVDLDRSHLLLLCTQMKYDLRNIWTTVHAQFDLRQNHVERHMSEKMSAAGKDADKLVTAKCAVCLQAHQYDSSSALIQVAPFFIERYQRLEGDSQYYLRILVAVDRRQSVLCLEMLDMPHIHDQNSRINVAWSRSTNTVWIGYRRSQEWSYDQNGVGRQKGFVAEGLVVQEDANDLPADKSNFKADAAGKATSGSVILSNVNDVETKRDMPSAACLQTQRGIASTLIQGHAPATSAGETANSSKSNCKNRVEDRANGEDEYVGPSGTSKAGYTYAEMGKWKANLCEGDRSQKALSDLSAPAEASLQGIKEGVQGLPSSLQSAENPVPLQDCDGMQQEEDPETHFQRTIMFGTTTVLTQTGKKVEAIEAHTALHRLPEGETTWIKLSKKPIEGVCWEPLLKGVGDKFKICMLGASDITGALLSSNRLPDGIKTPPCFCGLSVL